MRTIATLLDEGEKQPAALGKSYVEHRSWLHPLKSFWRIFAVHIVGFHALAATAFVSQRGPIRFGDLPLPLSTIALTHAALAFAHDVLEYAFRVGSLRSKFPIGGLRHYAFKRRGLAFLRVAVLVVLAGTLVASLDVSGVPSNLKLSTATFGRIALGYGAVQLLLLFPQFIDTESTWGLKSIGQPFAKGSVLKYAKPPVGEIAVYASFWIMIACGKAVANYYYLFLPMRGPSLELYNRTMDSGRDGYERGFAGVNLALAWLSVLAMFFVDGQLWFSVFCSIFGFIGGVIKGMKRWRVADAVTRLPLSLIGKWNSDRRLHADFVRSCALFKKKCSAKPDVTIARPLVKHGVRADIPTTSAGALPVRSFDTGEEKERSARWASYGAIASAWNGVIEELFMGDLVSSEEAKNLCFWCPNACPPKSTSSRVRRLLSSNATRMRQYFSIATTNRNYFFLPIFLLSGSDRTAPVWRLCRSGPTETHLAASSDFSRAISYFLESVFLRGRAESFHVTVVRPAMFLSRNQDASFSTGFSKRLCAVFDAAEAVAVSASARTDDFIAATVHFLNFIPSFWTASASSLDAHKEVQRLIERSTRRSCPNYEAPSRRFGNLRSILLES